MSKKKVKKSTGQKPEVIFEKVDLKSFEQEGRTILASLQQKQLVHIDQQQDEVGGTYLRGDFDMVNWKDLSNMGGAIKSTLVAVGIAENELMYSMTLLYRTSDHWNPVWILLGTNTPDKAYDSQLVDKIVEAVVVGLGQNASGRIDDISITTLDTSVQPVVKRVVNETLQKIGGKKIIAPIAVLLEQRHATLEGKLAPKPSQAVLTPTLMQLKGKLTAFDTETSEISLRTSDKKIAINFNPTFVDLIKLAQVIVGKQDVSISANKTISVRGTAVYQYVPDKKLNLSS